jgi:hypothetical protein
MRKQIYEFRQTKKGSHSTVDALASWYCLPEKVSLKDDFNALYAEAQTFQNTHGHDRGNGWLLFHPIKKLKLLQEYKCTKGKGKTA